MADLIVESVETLRREYNTAIANGLVMKARAIARRLAAAEREQLSPNGR